MIERNGQVVVRPPEGLTPEHVDALVESKRMWILPQLGRFGGWKDLNAAAVAREWVNGETFPVPRQGLPPESGFWSRRRLEAQRSRFCLSRELIEQRRTHRPAREAPPPFESPPFYTDKGQQRYANRVAHYAPKVGVEVCQIRVKDMGYRWASCGSTRTLNFHWKCMMAPPRIIDYIAVHELCHFHHRNHSDAFLERSRQDPARLARAQGMAARAWS